MKGIRIICILPILLLMHNCATGPAVSNYNYAYLYDDQPSVPRPDFQVFHSSDSISTLFIKLNSNNILYSKPQTDTVFKAHLSIKYKVYNWEDREILIDSATVPIMDVGANNSKEMLIGHIDLKVPIGHKYFLEVKLRDNNRDLTVLNYSMIDKTLNANRQFFLIRDHEGKTVLGNVLLNNEQFSIIKSPLVVYDTLKMQSREGNLPLAAPPFADDSKSDPNLDFGNVQLFNFENDSSSFRPENSTIHHFFPGNMENQGFYLYHYREGFPYITSAEQMIEPLRYISTNEEFSKLEEAGIKKQALDEYWIELAGNEEKAREVMAEFYGRVENSNKYFTSYKEGWKTDRGIIYIIYGIPTTIYKTPTFESWIYGEETNVLSLHFKFRKLENNMSNNDYRLARDIAMKPSWYRAVDSWRQGRISK